MYESKLQTITYFDKRRNLITQFVAICCWKMYTLYKYLFFYVNWFGFYDVIQMNLNVWICVRLHSLGPEELQMEETRGLAVRSQSRPHWILSPV